MTRQDVILCLLSEGADVNMMFRGRCMLHEAVKVSEASMVFVEADIHIVLMFYSAVSEASMGFVEADICIVLMFSRALSEASMVFFLIEADICIFLMINRTQRVLHAT